VLAGGCGDGDDGSSDDGGGGGEATSEPASPPEEPGRAAPEAEPGAPADAPSANVNVDLGGGALGGPPPPRTGWRPQQAADRIFESGMMYGDGTQHQPEYVACTADESSATGTGRRSLALIATSRYRGSRRTTSRSKSRVSKRRSSRSTGSLRDREPRYPIPGAPLVRVIRDSPRRCRSALDQARRRRAARARSHAGDPRPRRLPRAGQGRRGAHRRGPLRAVPAPARQHLGGWPSGMLLTRRP
jgi:hypothetical protein